VQRLFALLRRAGIHFFTAQSWTPDQLRTTPQVRRVAQHPGNGIRARGFLQQRRCNPGTSTIVPPIPLGLLTKNIGSDPD
jgi:hypothetical protein